MCIKLHRAMARARTTFCREHELKIVRKLKQPDWIDNLLNGGNPGERGIDHWLVVKPGRVRGKPFVLSNPYHLDKQKLKAALDYSDKHDLEFQVFDGTLYLPGDSVLVVWWRPSDYRSCPIQPIAPTWVSPLAEVAGAFMRQIGYRSFIQPRM